MHRNFSLRHSPLSERLEQATHDNVARSVYWLSSLDPTRFFKFYLFRNSTRIGRFYTRGRIIRLDELSFVIRLERRTTEDSSSRRIMRLVPVFILKTHNQTNNECLPKFVLTDNASSSRKTTIEKLLSFVTCHLRLSPTRQLLRTYIVFERLVSSAEVRSPSSSGNSKSGFKKLFFYYRGYLVVQQISLPIFYTSHLTGTSGSSGRQTSEFQICFSWYKRYKGNG